MKNDKVIPFRSGSEASNSTSPCPDTRLEIRALLDDATPIESCPVGVCVHQGGRWRRASLVFCLAGSYGMIVTQGLSGDAQVVPAGLNLGLMAMAVISMKIADRQDRRT